MQTNAAQPIADRPAAPPGGFPAPQVPLETSLVPVVAAGEFRCGECGYGVVVVRRELPACPMCGARAWGQSSFGRTRLAPLPPPA